MFDPKYNQAAGKTKKLNIDLLNEKAVTEARKQ